MAHNIVPGTVTSRRDHVPFRVTFRRIVRRTLWITLGTLLAMLALGIAVQAIQGDWTGVQQRQEQEDNPDNRETPQLPDRFTPKSKRV